MDYLGEGKDINDSPLGEFKDDNFADSGAITEAASHLYLTLNLEHKRIASQIESKIPVKEDSLFYKYSPKMAMADLMEVIKVLEGLYPSFKLSAGDKRATEGNEPQEDKDKRDGDDQEEGGDDEGQLMEGGGSGNYCEALINAYSKHAYFADLVKAAILKRELEGGFEIDDYHDFKWDKNALMSTAWSETATICSIYLQNKHHEKKTTAIWAKCKCSDEDIAELKETSMEKDKFALVFPGLTVFYASADDCPPAKGPEAHHEIQICIKNVYAYEVDGKFVVHHLFGRIVAADVVNHKYQIEEVERRFKSIGEFKQNKKSDDIIRTQMES